MKNIKTHDMQTHHLLQSQLGVFLEWMSAPEQTKYNIAFHAELPKDTDTERLEDALRRMVADHPDLTMHFTMEDGMPKQWRDPSMKPNITHLKTTDSNVDELFKGAFMRSFDLLGGEPLHRFCIATTESGRIHLFADIHHTLFDGYSYDKFRLDIEQYYADPAYTAPQTYGLCEAADDEQASYATAEYQQAREATRQRVGGSEFVQWAAPSADMWGELIEESALMNKAETDKWCEENGVRPSQLIMAAFGLVMAKALRKNDFCFQGEQNGRNEKTVDNYGMYVKGMPVHINIDYGQTIAQYFDTLRKEWRAAKAESVLYPMTHLHTDTQMMPSVCFNFLAGKGNFYDRPFNGSTLHWCILRNVVNDRDLMIEVFADDDNYDIRANSSEKRIERKTLQTIAAAVKNCAECIVNSSLDSKLDSVEITTEAERAELVKLGKGKDIPYDESQTLVTLFRKQAAATPDNVAVLFRDKQLTYREVDKLSDNIAAYLHNECGVGPEQAVGVMIDRSELMVIYPLAIMKAGAAYMPLDPHFPAERLMYMIGDAGVKLILTEDNLLEEAVPDYKGNSIKADEALALPDCTTLPEGPKIDNMMVVLYTSGSTGNPKGVVLTQRNLVNWCDWYKRETSLTPADRSAAYANFGFDAHMIDLYPLLTTGGSVLILPSEVRMDLNAIHTIMEDNGVTVTFFTTQVGVQLATLFKFKHLRVLSVGGERLMPVPVPDYTMYNIYGPTECSICCTVYVLQKDNEVAPIGRPLDNYSLYVMDETMHLLPQGMAGELLVAGDGVGREYLNNPKRTEEQFINVGGVKMYRTGDLVRWNEDGNLEYIDRLDGMVKMRGLRIEIGEIEARLKTFEGVEMCAVAVKEVNGVQMLSAYYTTADNADLDTQKIKEHLAQTLTEFMVPESYMRMDKMPLTPNGKVNRKALPDPQIEVGEIVAPETDTEKSLFALLAELLKTDCFGITTNLVHMGLTSIMSMRLAANIQQKLGASLKMKQITANPTIRAIAQIVDNEGQNGTTEIKTYEKRDAYPLSESQMGVFADWQMNPDSVQYNIPTLVTVNGHSATEVKAAVEKVVEAHPAIKSHFALTDGNVAQLRLDDETITVGVEKLNEEPPRSFFQEKITPFNLLEGPLCRFTVYQTPQHIYLLADVHHSIFDGFSMVAFTADLYEALCGNDVEKEKYLSFDHSLMEQEAMQGEQMTKAEEYFRTLLNGAETTEYPNSSDANPEAEGIGVAQITVEAKPINDFCKKNDITANAYFLEMLTQVLHRATRSDNVTICTIHNGRPETEWMHTFGMFVKTIPVVSNLDDKAAPQTTIAQCAANFDKQLSDTRDNDIYPFTQIAETFHIRPSILYVYNADLLDADSEMTKCLSTEVLELQKVKTPLTFTVASDGKGNYTLHLKYDPKRYSQADMHTLVNALQAASLNALQAPSIAQLSLLNAETTAQVAKFHTTAQCDVPYKLYYQAVEENAVKYADRTALIAKDGELTFSQFNAEANKVAHALMRRGVKRGDRVVLLLPRRTAVIVCMYGVSKTGAAYIPCDPEYPADRINLILTDSEAQYIITTADKAPNYPAERVILVDDIYKSANSQPGDENNPNVEVSPDDLAYLIYTSGSTGRPKGVMLRHRGIANYLYDHEANVHIHALHELDVKTFVSITTLSFDMSLKEFAGSLFNGITTVLADEDEVMDPTLLAQLMERTHAEAINGTCSRIQSYMELDAFQTAIRHCKTVWAGGEMYTPAMLKQLQGMGPRLFNTYGPTEITVSSNIAELTHAKRVTVGRPLLNYVEYIVDIFGNELPLGFSGELLIGGPGVAKGYNNLPEMTEQRFIDFRGERVYRSGDLARWTADGEVEILGRIDNQVKLRGFRIELGEIEGVISSFPGVQNAVADVKKLGGIEHLCAYYTSNAEIDEQALKEYVSRKLTEYMVPSVYMRLDKLPLTPNGKMNRKALPLPELTETDPQTGGYAAPEGAAETDICEAFAKVLGRDRIGANDDFFLLGGTSISAIKVVAALATKGYKISFKDVFEYKTPRILAVVLKIKEENVAAAKPVVQTVQTTEQHKSEYADILDANTLDAFRNGERQQLGNVLLTGATGFMGVHLLRELLENETGHIYCVLRRKADMSAADRLQTIYFYYFDEMPAQLFEERITVIEGDLTDQATIDNLPTDIDTVINCAANVKHFSAGNDIEKVNVDSVRNLVEWCIAHDVRLVHTSTVSVAGQSVDGCPSPDTKITEHMFDFGQALHNQYARSKYDAEELIFKAIRERGLNAKIMRVGTLSSRNTDGEFQINFKSNAFMGRIRALSIMGCVSYDMLDAPCEFSPIDDVARAVRLLCTTPREMVVFHPCNNHTFPLGDVLRILNVIGADVKPMENDEFQEKVRQTLADESKAAELQPLLAYNENGQHDVRILGRDSHFTTQVLYRLGFNWSYTSWDYVERFVKQIHGFDFL